MKIFVNHACLQRGKSWFCVCNARILTLLKQPYKIDENLYVSDMSGDR